MTVDRAQASFRSEYGGRTVFFCSESCKRRFDEDPARYIDDTGREAGPLAHAGAHRHDS